MAIQNIIDASARLDKANQYNPFEEGLKQVDKVYSAMETFEKETNEKAMNNAENFVDGAIGFDLLPTSAQDIIYGKFKTIGEDMAKAENAGDRKKVRELKLKGVNLISVQNTIGSILKDHSEDLLGTDGEGSYSSGSNTSMMDMLINKEYTIRDDETNGMVIDFTGAGYTGKAGIKLEELDEHVFLKMKDGALAYNENIKTIRNNAKKGLPFEQDAFKKTIKRTLNTDQKLITSIWDDNFTLKDGKTLKEIWEEENVGKDANEYLRTSGGEWKNYKEELRTWASNKLFTGGENNFRNYTPQKTNPMGDDGVPVFDKSIKVKKGGNNNFESAETAKYLYLGLGDGAVNDPITSQEYRYLEGKDGLGWYVGDNLFVDDDGKEIRTTNDLVKNFGIQDNRFQNLETKIVKADNRNSKTYDNKYKTGADFTTLEGGDDAVSTKLNKLMFGRNDNRNANGLYFAPNRSLFGIKGSDSYLYNTITLYDKNDDPYKINGGKVKYRVKKSDSMEQKSAKLKTILEMLNEERVIKTMEYELIDSNNNETEEETPKTPKKGFNFKSE